MIKSTVGKEVDPEAVKKFNEEQIDWTAFCPVCKVSISGTLSSIRAHIGKCHGQEGK